MLKLLITSLLLSVSTLSPTVSQPSDLDYCGTLGMNNNVPRIMVIQGDVIYKTDGVTYIDTNDGNGWCVEYENDYAVGDKCYITYDTKSTDDIYDDAIINILPSNI